MWLEYQSWRYVEYYFNVMKLETILKVIEIIRRSGEQSKYICMDNEYFETYSAKFHILVSINF